VIRVARKTVIAQLRLDAGRSGTPANHRIGVRLRQHGSGELAGAAADGAEQRPLRISGKLGAVEIGDQIFLEVVVALHCVPLPALLPQPHPKPAVLSEDIVHRHSECRADPGKRIDHQRAVAQAGVISGVDAVEQRAGLGRIEHRRLPGGDTLTKVGYSPP
jgi:hypothetical protein